MMTKICPLLAGTFYSSTDAVTLQNHALLKNKKKSEIESTAILDPVSLSAPSKTGTLLQVIVKQFHTSRRQEPDTESTAG